MAGRDNAITSHAHFTRQHQDYKHARPPQCGWQSSVREPRTPSAMPTQSHQTPRLTLLDSTFWEVLPANYDKIKQRWIKIATLHDEAKSDLLPSDRAGAVNSLKAELEMLEKDIDEYRNIVRGIDITIVAEIYVVGGKARPRALQVAKEDFENVEGSLKAVENRMQEVRAELVYGFEKQE